MNSMSVPKAMLRELLEDNRRLNEFMRSAHAVCQEHDDVATASLLENWIDETERRIGFCRRSSAASKGDANAFH
jgi:starvation-inducible DNA-binding protein